MFKIDGPDCYEKILFWRSTQFLTWVSIILDHNEIKHFLGNHCRMSELSNYERRMFDCLKFKNDSLFKLDKNKYSCISVETRLTFNDQADSVHTCTRRPQNRSFFSRADHTIDFFKARDSTILIMLLALHPIIHKDKEWRLSLLQYLFNNFYTCT